MLTIMKTMTMATTIYFAADLSRQMTDNDDIDGDNDNAYYDNDNENNDDDDSDMVCGRLSQTNVSRLPSAQNHFEHDDDDGDDGDGDDMIMTMMFVAKIYFHFKVQLKPSVDEICFAFALVPLKHRQICQPCQLHR